MIGRAASVRAESINPEARTVEIVWTTGATLQSCADVLLKEGGAKSVSALTMARVLPAELS